MPRLFGRKLLVEFRAPNETFSSPAIKDPNALIIESLSEGRSSISAKFSVEKNLSAGTANVANFTFTNLSRKTRQRLTRQKQGRLIALAGYEDNLDIIFIGDISRIRHVKNGTEWTTNFSAGDGQKAMKAAPVSFTFPKGASFEVIMKSMFSAMKAEHGIDTASAEAELSKGNPSKLGPSVYAKGYCSMANVVDTLSELAKHRGKSLSIQNSKCQINTPVDPTHPDKKTFLISRKSGLISSSDSGEDGVINITTLMYPQLLPGDAVRIESESVEGGFYRVEDISQRGDTRGTEWYSDMTLKPLKTGIKTSADVKRADDGLEDFRDEIGLQSIDPSDLQSGGG